MSAHFKRSLAAIAAIIVLLLGAYLYLKHRIHDVLNPPHIALPANDKELITYDENRHRIIVVTPKGTTTSYGRDPSVEIRNDGTVKVNSHAYGFEMRPFLGLGYQDTGRAYLGLDLFYLHSFDGYAAVGFGNTSHAFAKPVIGMAWNFYSNTSIAVGVNPINIILYQKPEVSVMLSTKL
jgi:hypothetical protein